MSDTNGFNKYNYPGIVTPFDHQRVTAAFCVANQRAFNFNDIGTGKTLATVWALDYLIDRAATVTHSLIIAPLSTLDIVWFRSIYSVNRDLKVFVLKGSKEKRLKLLKQAARAARRGNHKPRCLAPDNNRAGHRSLPI
jgi:SNF2 family DNA or RNA helicase